MFGDNWYKRLLGLVFVFALAACNMPSNSPATTTSTTVTIESKVTSAWKNCVSNTGVFTHVCLYAQLTSLPEATPFEAGFTVPANAVVLVNDSSKGINPFIINGNQPAVEGEDYQQVAAAQSGLTSTYLTLKGLTMATSGKQIVLTQAANAYNLFPGWPNWPPVLPTALVIQTQGPVDPTGTPNVIPPAFTSGDFLNLWASLTPQNNITMLLDEAYGKWGQYYGGTFTSVTFSRVPAGSIIWSTTTDNLVDLSQQPIDPYGGCLSTINAANNVAYTTCDLLVIQPPFKYLHLEDWQNFEQGMLPAPPVGIVP